jgi:hypothetical protein
VNRGKRSPLDYCGVCVRSCGGNLFNCLILSEEDDRKTRKKAATSRDGLVRGVPKEKGFLCMQISIAWPPNALTISHCVKQIPQGGFSQTYFGSPFARLYICPEVSYSLSGLGFAVHLLRRNLYESNSHIYIPVHDAMPFFYISRISMAIQYSTFL